MHIKGMIFDLDGTLVDTLPIVVTALKETFLEYSGLAYTTEEISQMFGPSEEGVIQRRVAAVDYPSALRMYIDRYSALQQQDGQAFPGVLDLLAELRARGIRSGVVTGKGPRTAAVTLRAIGLETYIETLRPGSPVGAVKPDAIRSVLAEWGIAPAQAAYVGDVPYDMQAAREAGVLPLAAGWARTATVKHGDGDAYFETVEALIDWIKGTAE